MTNGDGEPARARLGQTLAAIAVGVGAQLGLLLAGGADPSVEPESITMNSQFRYSWAARAGNVSRNAQASL